MLAAYLAVGMPMMATRLVRAAQPFYDQISLDWSSGPVIVMGEYAAPGVRHIFIMLIEVDSGSREFFNIGTFYETSITEHSYTAWDHQANPLPTGHPYLDSPGFTLAGVSTGVMSGTVVPANGLDFAPTVQTFSYTRTHFQSSNNETTSMLVVGNEISNELVEDWFENASNNDALPTSLPGTSNTQQLCFILEATAAAGAVVLGAAASIAACQADANTQMRFGLVNCGTSHGYGAPGGYCQMCYDLCVDCCKGLHTDDGLICVVTGGVNGPDGDYNNCSLGCACP
jgi:hypothetical protein